MGAAEERAFGLHPVAYDFATAVFTGRGKPVDGAFEAVEGIGVSGGDDLEGEVVVVAADLALSHGDLLG
jgi:hypothetical protein